jgi:hypothetical protein
MQTPAELVEISSHFVSCYIYQCRLRLMLVCYNFCKSKQLHDHIMALLHLSCRNFRRLLAGCSTMDLGIVIPTSQIIDEWNRVKSFIVSTLSQIDIGGSSDAVRVSVVTYRGDIITILKLRVRLVFVIFSR